MFLHIPNFRISLKNLHINAFITQNKTALTSSFDRMVVDFGTREWYSMKKAARFSKTMQFGAVRLLKTRRL